MADQQYLELTKKTYATLCATLEEHKWNFRRDDEKMEIEYGVNGDDMPMRFFIRFDADRALMRVFSPMPLAVKEDKRLEMAVAISMINNRLADGCFEMDITNGELRFRVCSCFCDSVLSPEVFLYFVQMSIKVVEIYNDKLYMLATGMISLEKFIEFFSENSN